jgi:hypothetical protein
MTKFASLLLMSVLFVVIFTGCESPFTPKGPYTDRMVVYGILTNRCDTQYVRVYSTYDPAGSDPRTHTSDNALLNANILVGNGAVPFRFQQEFIPRLDKSRYTDDILVYDSYPFKLETGKTYSLSVTTENYSPATSTVTVPKSGRIQVLNAYILNGGGSEDEQLVIFGWIRELTYGVLMRLFFIYDVLEGNSWVTHREEIPNGIFTKDDGSNIFFFPILARRMTSDLIKDKEENETFVFARRAYFASLGAIYARYPARGVHVKQALLVLTQVEQNLYTYSKLANGFQDPYSIRTDQPDYTNIAGGRGIFGAMVDDSMYVNLTLQ